MAGELTPKQMHMSNVGSSELLLLRHQALRHLCTFPFLTDDALHLQPKTTIILVQGVPPQLIRNGVMR